jgi:hypothetical protein
VAAAEQVVPELVAAVELHLFSLLQLTAAAQEEAYNLNLAVKAAQEEAAVELQTDLAVKVIHPLNLHLLLLHKVIMEVMAAMLEEAAAAQTAAEVMLAVKVVRAAVAVLHL